MHREISTHTPLARRDFMCLIGLSGRIGFLLTRLLRGATFPHIARAMSRAFLLTRPMRGATCERYSTSLSGSFLLTRLLRGATGILNYLRNVNTFLLTRLLRGATGASTATSSGMLSFLLTRLLRGATILLQQAMIQLLHFYSHASCEARPR